MEKRKKLWFAYLPLDAKGVERLLNERAEQGWALAVEEDGVAFRVPIEKTNRVDLRYHVTCAMLRNQETLPQEIEEKQAQGWQPVATVNHFDIYASMPCQEPNAPPEKGRERLCLSAFFAWLRVILLMVALVAVAWVNRLPLPGADTWYLSNLSLFMRVTLPLFALGSVYYLLWIAGKWNAKGSASAPKQRGMFLRSGLYVGAMLWLVVGLVLLLVDLVSNRLAISMLLLCFVVAGGLCCRSFHWGKPETLRTALSLVVALVLGLSLLLAAVSPSQSRAEIGDCPWRNSLSRVVHAEDLDLHPTQLQGASYERIGSLFVTRTEYWESWEDLSLSNTVYDCKGRVFRSVVVKQILADGDWTPIQSQRDQAFQSSGTDRVLLVEGNTVLELTCDQPIDAILPDIDHLVF